MDRVKHLNDLIEFPKDGILSKSVFEGSLGEADLFMLPKGAKISTHTSSRDAAVMVLQGEAEFMRSMVRDLESRTESPGSVIRCTG